MPTEPAISNLPSELLERLVELLPAADKQSFALVSHSARSVVLPSQFGHLLVKDYGIAPKLQNIHDAGKDVKEAVRKLTIYEQASGPGTDEERTLLFLVLGSLSNLQSLTYRQGGPLVPASRLQELLSTIRKAPLTELFLNTSYILDDSAPWFDGLSGLQKLFITWGVDDHPTNTGSSLTQLRKLIVPSLSTLVSLRIKDISESKSGAAGLDLRELKAAGETLREFEYQYGGSDDGILGIVPEVFPSLTKLRIQWGNPPPAWKDSHTHTLSKLKKLTALGLSFDLEQAANDPAPGPLPEAAPWVSRGYTRRLTVTEKIVKELPQLQRVSWVQLGLPLPTIRYRAGPGFKHPQPRVLHRFIVLEDGTISGAKAKWMNDITLEDLPNNIVTLEDDGEDEDLANRDSEP